MEQRKNLRFPVKFRSSFSSIGLVGGEGNIVDLSIRGCRIESSIDVQPGASLDVRITVVENDPPNSDSGSDCPVEPRAGIRP